MHYAATHKPTLVLNTKKVLKQHTSSSGEIGALGLGDTGAEECGKRRLGHWGLEGHRFDRSRAARRASLLEGRGAHQEELQNRSRARVIRRR